MPSEIQTKIPPAPKRQPYPASKITVGAVLYSVLSYVVDGKTKTEIIEWVVRTIRARRNSLTWRGVDMTRGNAEKPKAVNMVQKNEFTWGKLSKKTGDYGWLKNIHSGYKRQFSVGADLPHGMFTTKRAAAVYALADEKRSLAVLEKDIRTETDPEVIEEYKAEMADTVLVLAALTRRVKSFSGEKKSAAAPEKAPKSRSAA
jgi:hypothetical protein